MVELMSRSEDQELVRALSLVRDNRERSGLTFEVTPSTAADAYGGWWLSIYDLRAFERSRASESELKVITETVPVVVEVEVDDDDDDDDDHYKKSKRARFAKKPSVSKVVSASYNQWSKSDFASSNRYSKPASAARPSSSVKPSTSRSSSSSSSLVYARSFKKSSGSYTRVNFSTSRSSSSKRSSSRRRR